MEDDDKYSDLENEEALEDGATLGRGILGSIVTTAVGGLLGGPIGAGIAGIATLIGTGKIINDREDERNSE